MYEQFRRYANIFFLCIGLLQQIPGVSPTGRFVTIVPLFIILCLTAAKEVLEDLKRHQADRRVNNDLVQVLTDTGKLVKKKWAEISVGDILKIENFSFFPADLILLSSSEPQGMCHIETANLDGGVPPLSVLINKALGQAGSKKKYGKGTNGITIAN